ncbi:MAG: hypothetical protein M1827_000875 [Pycnora praestabilis]|nr:MAG: hypothetical protein M1827_000875 [Pycnora praestabilis]
MGNSSSLPTLVRDSEETGRGLCPLEIDRCHCLLGETPISGPLAHQRAYIDTDGWTVRLTNVAPSSFAPPSSLGWEAPPSAGLLADACYARPIASLADMDKDVWCVCCRIWDEQGPDMVQCEEQWQCPIRGGYYHLHCLPGEEGLRPLPDQWWCQRCTLRLSLDDRIPFAEEELAGPAAAAAAKRSRDDSEEDGSSEEDDNPPPPKRIRWAGIRGGKSAPWTRLPPPPLLLTAAAAIPSETPSPACDGSAAVAATVAPAASKKKGTSWTEHEENVLIQVMTAIIESGKTKGERRWVVASQDLKAFGIERSGAGIKAHWLRGMRETTGLDERDKPRPDRMRTTLPKKRTRDGLEEPVEDKALPKAKRGKTDVLEGPQETGDGQKPQKRKRETSKEVEKEEDESAAVRKKVKLPRAGLRSLQKMGEPVDGSSTRKRKREEKTADEQEAADLELAKKLSLEQNGLRTRKRKRTALGTALGLENDDDFSEGADL